MNRPADEKLRAAALEWLQASPAAGVSLNVESAPNKAPVFVCVGTEAQLHQVKPEDMVAALRRAWEALDKAIAAKVGDADLSFELVNAWQATKYHLDRLK